jgi:hypothetical protein
MISVGVVGTAKNSGKTTTLKALMNELRTAGKSSAITGIGYDGESFDNLTCLPKPRLHFEKGDLIATSSACISKAYAKLKVLEKTNLITSLGEVCIAEVAEPGLVVIAGPNTRKGLNILLHLFSKYSPDYLLVDGSLSRISPMAIVDQLVIATGGARNVNIVKLTLEAEAIDRIFNFNIWEESFDNIPGFSSLADTTDFHQILSSSKHRDCILISGLISLKELLNLRKEYHGIIIIESPINLLTSGVYDTKLFSNFFNYTNICYISKPVLKAFTVNPFYPEEHNFSYRPAYLDSANLLNSIKLFTKVPVFDVLSSPGKILT